MLQLVEYLNVDYPEAVRDGEVINPAEYQEMVEFAGRIMSSVDGLDDSPAQAKLKIIAGDLVRAVADRASSEEISVLARALRTGLMTSYDVVLTPREPPNLRTAAARYGTQCAVCHGAAGYGDGPAAQGLFPPPTNFRDQSRAEQRSLYGLFTTITLGVEGTSMVGQPEMTDSERWSLAFYIGAMGTPADIASNGKAVFERHPISLKDAVTQTPRQLAEMAGRTEAIAAWVRSNPDVLFPDQDDALNIAKAGLQASFNAYQSGDVDSAQRQAVIAYLDGFELVEAPLTNVDSGLMRETERAMMAYRHALQRRAPAEEVQARLDEAITLLQRSESALSSGSLSPAVAFTGSLVILVREGIEAILVLAALITFLIRSDRRDALVYVHGGWIAALIAGAATWLASSYLIDISGAAREMTEGMAALVAAVILLYVGFWMHQNADARRWNQFLQDKMHNALSSSTLWTLSVVSFLAVYREIFETILFYQALWIQVEDSAQASVIYGGIVAMVLLLSITWLFARFSVRLPLKQFFMGSAVLMVFLAFVLSGKGVVALQEAGTLRSDPISFPTIDMLGIYPNIEALALQGIVLLSAIMAVLFERRRTASGA
ncbi:MAG: FTR1 family protein [Pseudomonadales bacterium]|nr:FTR1 family protein [Pseudomonadales bacterium]